MLWVQANSRLPGKVFIGSIFLIVAISPPGFQHTDQAEQSPRRGVVNVHLAIEPFFQHHRAFVME